MSNTDKTRNAILLCLDGQDIGISAAALGQAARKFLNEVKKLSPDHYEFIRRDFEQHLKGEKVTKQ